MRSRKHEQEESDHQFREKRENTLYELCDVGKKVRQVGHIIIPKVRVGCCARRRRSRDTTVDNPFPPFIMCLVDVGTHRPP